MLARRYINVYSWISHFYTADCISNVSNTTRDLLCGLLLRCTIVSNVTPFSSGITNTAMDNVTYELDSIRDMLWLLIPEDAPNE